MTIMIAGFLAFIAFYLQQDYRGHHKHINDLRKLYHQSQEKFDGLRAEMQRNVTRDRMVLRIVEQVCANILIGEKLQESARAGRKSSQQKQIIADEKRYYLEKIHKRLREAQFLLTEREDKSYQILTEIEASEPDLETKEFLIEASKVPNNQAEEERIKEALVIVSRNLQ